MISSPHKKTTASTRSYRTLRGPTVTLPATVPAVLMEEGLDGGSARHDGRDESGNRVERPRGTSGEEQTETGIW